MTTRTIDQKDLAEELVAGLEALGQDRAAMARLKRCAGQDLSECPGVFSLFYRLLPSKARGLDWLERPTFLVATLFPLAPERGEGSLGAALAQVVQHDRQRKESTDRRLTIILDCSAEELPFRLRQTIALLAGQSVALDWRQLLLDLLQWDLPSRPAQKRWARDYFGTITA